MATNTSRVALRKPATSDNVDVVQDLNNNYDKIDLHLGTFICTSSTRPTGTDRFTGRVILETDTLQRLIWDGSAWQYLDGWFQGTWSTSITGTTSGTGAVGNGTVSANYVRNGAWVDFWFRYTLGSTSSFASVVGSIQFNLPVATTMAAGTAIGYGEITDSSSADRFVTVIMVEDANNISMTISRAASAKVNNSNPWSWANGDTIRHSGRYKVTA